MRALIATRVSQGARSDDFDWCTEGELVWLPEVCPTGRHGGTCQCVRSFSGVSSHRRTTTAVVRDIEGLTLHSCIQMVRYSLAAEGLPDAWVPRAVDRMLAIATDFAPGTVLERRLDMVGPRFDAHTRRLLPKAHLARGVRHSA